MTKEEIDTARELYLAVIKETIKETVNGKIDVISQKLDLHIQETRQYISDDNKWKLVADPYIKLAANISGTWKFLVYIITGIIVFLGLYKLK